MDSSTAPLPRQEASILSGSDDRMTTTPFRPLPVGGVPAWLLGPLSATLQPLMPLTPSRAQHGADSTRQERFRPPHIPLASQLWLIATPASPRTLMTSPMMTTRACSITGPNPSPRLPIGEQKGIPPLTVSVPNRSKRDDCCSARPPSARGLTTKPAAGFARLRSSDGA